MYGHVNGNTFDDRRLFVEMNRHHSFVCPHQCLREKNVGTNMNFWVGIIDENIGLYFLPLKLNGAYYTNFLREQLPILLENVVYA